MKAKEILIEAANLLESKGWTQQASARDSNGDDVSYYDEEAVCYCILGALDKVNNQPVARAGLDSEGNKAYTHLKATIGGMIAQWNDQEGQTKENVIKTIREAAETIKE